MDPEAWVAAMDAAGIGLQMISPNPITYFTRLDARSATDYARAHNDAIAEAAGRHPDGLSARPSCRCRMFRRRSPNSNGPFGNWVCGCLHRHRYRRSHPGCARTDDFTGGSRTRCSGLHPSVTCRSGRTTRRYPVAPFRSGPVAGLRNDETLAVAALRVRWSARTSSGTGRSPVARWRDAGVRAICWLRADCTRFRSIAARPMEPSSTTRTKYRSCRSSIVRRLMLTPANVRPG